MKNDLVIVGVIFLVALALVLAFCTGINRNRNPEPVHIVVEGPNLYPTVPLADIADGKWDRPRARVVGTITEIRREADGDWHLKLEDGDRFIICEVIPEMPMSLPKVGSRVAVFGIIREDKHHGWFEIHPVTKWAKP